MLNRFTDSTTAGLEQVGVAVSNGTGGVRGHSLTVDRVIVTALDAVVIETKADLVWLTS